MPEGNMDAGPPVVEREFEILNRLGLHARAAAQFVHLANRFASEIRILKDGMEVNGKSIMGILMLAAAQGSRISVAVAGDDAQQALTVIGQLIDDGFGEK
jgi:phosphocarrier protein